MATIADENAKNVRKSMDVLIEIEPTDYPTITITNENLINCTVSLRSDLSKWSPTLPESEINVDAYFDADISDVIAGVPDGTPVTYSAGYPGDMSTTRNFYLAEQITWSDNVLHIHAVDLVSKLGEVSLPAIKIYDSGCISRLYYLIVILAGEIITGINAESRSIMSGLFKGSLYFNSGLTLRDIIACIMNQFHVEFPAKVDGYLNYWPTYVDAGIPTATITKPSSRWDIYEADCGNIVKNTERPTSEIVLDHIYCNVNKEVHIEAGSAEWVYGVGAYLNFNELSYDYVIGLNGGPALDDDWVKTLKDAGYTSVGSFYNRVLPLIPTGADGRPFPLARHPAIKKGNVVIAYKIPSNTEQRNFESVPYSAADKMYSNFVPWDAYYDPGDFYPENLYPAVPIRSMADLWAFYQANGVIDSDVTSIDLTISGDWPETKDETLTFHYANHGETVNESAILQGNFQSNDGTTKVYPNESYRSVAERSNIVGSFTWKGDPRMQPRDVFTFYNLEYGLLNENGETLTDENGEPLYGGGSSIDCTIETITLTHSGGGLSAEITYREGIC